MKSIFKNLLVAITVIGFAASCTKDEVINTDANAGLAGASTFTLSNRLLAGFVLDSTAAGVPAGALPTGYNNFRKQLTYDTIATANKPKIDTVGQVITIAVFIKGDDAAISNSLNGINFRFFGTPTLYPFASSASNWVKLASNPPQSFIQAAEDSIRGFIPKATDVLATVASPAIAAGSTPTFTITKVAAENINGVSYSTYVILLTYSIPPAFAGKLISVNFCTRTSLSGASPSNFRNDLGNVNWNYAFRVK